MFRFKRKNQKLTIIALLFLLSIFTVLITIYLLQFGGNYIPIQEIFKHKNLLITLHLRTPRLIADFMIGAGLSIVGFSFQTVVRNPLADPYLFGISGAAAFGYIVGAIFLAGSISAYTLSIIFSLITIILVIYLSNIKNELSISSLVLTGVAISFFYTSIISIMSVFLSDKFAKNILLWYMGNTQNITLKESLLSLILIIILFLLMLFDMSKLFIIKIGELFAEATGIDVKKIIFKQYLLGSLITVIIVAKCGAIGFIGMVVPHIIRLIIKKDFVIQYIFTFFLGGIIVMLIDTISKVIFYPTEIPIGVITALFGSPFLIILLRKYRNVTN